MLIVWEARYQEDPDRLQPLVDAPPGRGGAVPVAAVEGARRPGDRLRDRAPEAAATDCALPSAVARP